MTIVGAATITMPCLPDREALRAAAAGAYGVPVGNVAVGDYFGDANPFPAGRQVYLNRWQDDGDGDLPVAFDQKIDESLMPQVDAAIQRMAELLGIVIVTDDAEREDPIVHLPDGTTQRRRLQDDPNGGLLLPPDLKVFARPGQPARAA